MNFFIFNPFSLSFNFFINSFKIPFSFISSISHLNIFIHNQIYFHSWSLGRDLMMKMKDRNFKHYFAPFSNLSKLMKFQLNQLFHSFSIIQTYHHQHFTIWIRILWWLYYLNVKYWIFIFQLCFNVTNQLKKSFWDKINNPSYFYFFSFHLKWNTFLFPNLFHLYLIK